MESFSGDRVKHCFNPRTHEECDFPDGRRVEYDSMFQSTHSRGVRLLTRLLSCTVVSFNPRTHEECDLNAADVPG